MRSLWLFSCMFIKMEGLWKNGIRSTPFFHSPVNEILNRKNKGQCGHCFFADLRNKKAVNNIIQGTHQHGYDHGKCHGCQQGQDWLFFHKCIVHSAITSINYSAVSFPDMGNKKPHNCHLGNCVAKRVKTRKIHTEFL